jgi:hypothetical protein
VSLLNVFLESESALVAVDTDGIARDGSRKAMSKLLTLPHLPAVIAMRGSAAFMAGLFHTCTSRGFDSFDELLDELALLLRIVDASVPGFLRDPAFPDIEIAVVGWSDRRSSMLARLYTKRGDEAEFTGRDSQGCIAPFDQASMAGIQRTADAVHDIARAQVRYMQAEQGIGGGRLILCHVDRDGLSLHHAETFERETVCLH